MLRVHQQLDAESGSGILDHCIQFLSFFKSRSLDRLSCAWAGKISLL